MWCHLDNSLAEELCFEELIAKDGKTTFKFSDIDNKNYYEVRFNETVYTYRLIQEFCYICAFDRYDSVDYNRKDVSHYYNIHYTCGSEYLDWFKKVSENLIGNVKLFNFQIIAEDVVIDIITDELPDIVKIAGTKETKM